MSAPTISFLSDYGLDDEFGPTQLLGGRAQAYRCVLEWARMELRDRPDGGAARLAQLRGELSRLEVAEAPAAEAVTEAASGPVSHM